MNKKTNDAAIAREKAHAKRQGPKITTRNGLLYEERTIITLPRADVIAIENGFMSAEAFVRHLEKAQAKTVRVPLEKKPPTHIAYWRGVLARAKAIHHTSNPYSSRNASVQHGYWEQGWDDAHTGKIEPLKKTARDLKLL